MKVKIRTRGGDSAAEGFFSMMPSMLDPLSSLAHKLRRLDPGAYGSLVAPPSGNTDARDLLEATRPSELIAGEIAQPADGDAMLAGLWLWFDRLDPAHAIVQSMDNATGSFWHAILHRREKDFSNSKYWFARCRQHPANATLAVQSGALINSHPADKSILKLTIGGWNADAFVDLVEQIHDRPDDSRFRLAIALQKLEWQLLFDHCARSAAG